MEYYFATGSKRADVFQTPLHLKHLHVSGKCKETHNENKQMKKIILIIGFLGLLVLAGLYAKRKYFDPKLRIENAKDEVTLLETNNELQNGDLIFQTSLSVTTPLLGLK